MPRYETTVPCPVCFSPAGALATCAECGWPLTAAAWPGGDAESRERHFAKELERAQRGYDSVAAARISPTDGRDLPFIRGGRPDEAEWTAALRRATVAADTLDTADRLRETIRRRLETRPEAGRLSVVEVGSRGITTTTVVSAEPSGMRRVDRGPVVRWIDLAPMLAAESPDELLFRLAGGFGGVDRAALWAELERTVPESVAIPGADPILVCAVPGWPVPEHGLEVLARRAPDAVRSRVVDVDAAELVGELVSQMNTTAALRGRLELVVAHVVPKNGRIVLRSERLFEAGAPVGAEQALTIRCAHTLDDGLVLAVVSWGHDNTRPRPVSIDSVRLRPGAHRLHAVLAGPGRVKFSEPAGVVPDSRVWSELVASLPRRFIPPVGDFDLICALDLGADRFDDRRALVSELVELLRTEYPERGRSRVAVVGYRAHRFRVGEEHDRVVYGRWLDTPDEAQRSLDGFRAFEPGPVRAAPIEDALHVIARRVGRIPPGRKVVLLTVGARPPHPPAEEPDGEIPCPLEYDWRSLLRRIRHRPGGLTSVAVLDSAKHYNFAWRQLGKTALHQLNLTDPRKLATAAGLLIPPSQRLFFPLPEPAE
ncbi:MAG TPA: hypothetical protein VFU43_24135 [Streptosporangiaceae bacterium]|nr:hypothetical protein [Streptosporangiaceae bacterium]